LSQLVSFKYGAVPIARQTGGLKDTVAEYEPATGKGNGFTFGDSRGRELLAAIKKAVSLYKNKTQWAELVGRDMKLDFSWRKSAKEYVELYTTILGKGS
jgi:starch synthase